MPNQSAIPLNRVFHALSDPTRMAVLERLSGGPAGMKELAQPFDMALPSFMQHLKVLEGSGLVQSEKKGRVRTYQLAPQPLQAAEHWLEKRRTHWQKRLDQLDNFLAELKEQQS
jgi:DNA-binding transcriptional ArsR family regulator